MLKRLSRPVGVSLRRAAAWRRASTLGSALTESKGTVPSFPEKVLIKEAVLDEEGGKEGVEDPQTMCFCRSGAELYSLFLEIRKALARDGIERTYGYCAFDIQMNEVPDPKHNYMVEESAVIVKYCSFFIPEVSHVKYVFKFTEEAQALFLEHFLLNDHLFISFPCAEEMYPILESLFPGTRMPIFGSLSVLLRLVYNGTNLAKEPSVEWRYHQRLGRFWNVDEDTGDLELKELCDYFNVFLNRIHKFNMEFIGLMDLYNHPVYPDFVAKDWNLRKVYFALELPLIPIVCKLNRNGIPVDIVAFQDTFKFFEMQLTHDAEQFREKYGDELIGKDKEFSSVEYHEIRQTMIRVYGLHLPNENQNDYGGVDVRSKSGIPAFFFFNRHHANIEKAEKLYQEWLDIRQRVVVFQLLRNVLQQMDPDCCLRSHFLPNFVYTGRFSSVDPNLQNIPQRTMASIIRKYIRPPRNGFVLIKADYSQVELKVFAHLTAAPVMLEYLKQGIDMHSSTAKLMFGSSTPYFRNIGKTITFGVLYGMSADGTAVRYPDFVSHSEALRLIEMLKSVPFRGYNEFQGRSVTTCIETGFLSTMSGRIINVRPLTPPLAPEIDIQTEEKTEDDCADNFKLRRLSVNLPVQGTAADLIKLSMIKSEDMILQRGLNARMVLTVHDEIVWEVQSDDIRAVTLAINDAMAFAGQALGISVPLEVKIEVLQAFGGRVGSSMYREFENRPNMYSATSPGGHEYAEPDEGRVLNDVPKRPVFGDADFDEEFTQLDRAIMNRMTS